MSISFYNKALELHVNEIDFLESVIKYKPYSLEELLSCFEFYNSKQEAEEFKTFKELKQLFDILYANDIQEEAKNSRKTRKR